MVLTTLNTIKPEQSERYLIEMEKKRFRKKWVKKLIGWVIVLAILVGIGRYAYTSLKKKYTVNYNSYTATIGSISKSMSFSGNLSLVNSETYSATAIGTVRKVFVKAGDTVKAGDKIMRLSTGETIEAGIGGTVNAVNYEDGDSVYAGDTLAQVADFKHMKVTFRVDEYDINSVSVGQECNLTVTALERKYTTTISDINHLSSSGGNVAYYTATVYVDVDEGVYPGMQITVTIPQESAENVVILKADAISFDTRNSAFVYMYGDDGVTLEKVEVEIGVSNGNYVEIKKGLNADDVVFVEAPVVESASGGLLSGLFAGTNITAGGGMPGNFGGGYAFGNGSGGDSSSNRGSGKGSGGRTEGR